MIPPRQKSRARREEIFHGSIIGMIHLPPLPGVPGHAGMAWLLDSALRDAEALLAGGVDGLLLENMHDFPCLRESEMGPEVAAAMTRAAVEVRKLAGDEVPIGIQVLFAANRTALAVAKAADLDFIRAEGWHFGHLSDKGWAEASAGSALRYRKQIEAEWVKVLADVKKKHASHAVTADLTIAQMASNLALQKADAVVVTGHSTGEATDLDDLKAVREATDLPVIIGSGLNEANIADYTGLYEAAIVGSSLKDGGDWRTPVDRARVERLVEAAG